MKPELHAVLAELACTVRPAQPRFVPTLIEFARNSNSRRETTVLQAAFLS
jgi:hypothetical protein